MLQQLREAGRFGPVATGESAQRLGIAQVEAAVPGHQKFAAHGGLRLKQLHPMAGFGQALGRQQPGWPAANYCELGRMGGRELNGRRSKRMKMLPAAGLWLPMPRSQNPARKTPGWGLCLAFLYQLPPVAGQDGRFEDEAEVAAVLLAHGQGPHAVAVK